MEENIINFFWIGDKVSQIEQLAFASCIANNMVPVLWSYNKIEGVADYVVLKNAKEILTEERFNFLLNELKLPIPNISDIFRYNLLAKMGGVYADTDIIFIKNLYDIKIEEYFCSTFEYNYGVCANNCLMRLKQSSSTTKYLLKELDSRLSNYIEGKVEKLNYCDLGPFLVQKCAKEMPINILPYDFINPISWRWTNKIIAFEKPDHKFRIKNFLRKYFPWRFEGRGYFVTDQTYAVHLCNEMWKHYNISKTKNPHAKSLTGKLKLLYQDYLPIGGTKY